jgi:hypothetical protein
MKSTTPLLGFTLLLLLVSSAVAYFDEPAPNRRYIRVDLHEGWNLLEYDSTNITPASEAQALDIRYLYYYLPTRKTFIRAYPNPVPVPELSEPEMEYTRPHTAWVYVENGGELERSYAYLLPKVDEIKLVDGWNVVAIVPDMTDSSLSEFKGDCGIIKAHQRDARYQDWDAFDEDGTITNSDVGYTMVLKVDGRCEFEIPVTEFPEPPPLPGGE